MGNDATTYGPIGSCIVPTYVLTITGPVNFDFGSRGAKESDFSIEKIFSGNDDYFQVIDTIGQDT